MNHSKNTQQLNTTNDSFLCFIIKIVGVFIIIFITIAIKSKKEGNNQVINYKNVNRNHQQNIIKKKETQPQQNVNNVPVIIKNTRKNFKNKVKAKTPEGFGSLISQTQKQNAIKYRNIRQDINGQLAKEQYNYYQQKYNISKYQQLPFCIVIPSFNNVQNNRLKYNLDSIRIQNYTNYHIFFFNDGSTDKTLQGIQQYFVNFPQLKQKFTLINNKIRLYAMPNLRNAAMNYCKPKQIFLIVDGDDELVGRQVLKTLNCVFQKQNSYFVYSNSINSKNAIGYSRQYREQVIKDNSYRKNPFLVSHLRAFYTELFRRIKDQDLKDQNGKYFIAANDIAICIPILEMAHKKITYLKQILYQYNMGTGMNNFLIRSKIQKGNQKLVRLKAPYQQIDNVFQNIKKSDNHKQQIKQNKKL